MRVNLFVCLSPLAAFAVRGFFPFFSVFWMEIMATRPGPTQPTMSKRVDLEMMKERMDKQANDQGLNQTTMSKRATSGLTTERTDKQATRPGIHKGLLSKQVPVVNESEKLMDKTLNLNVEIEGVDKVTMMELLNAVKDTCGRVLGCRFKGPNKYELTMSNPRGRGNGKRGGQG